MFIDIWDYHKKNPFYSTKTLSTKFNEKSGIPVSEELIDTMLDECMIYGEKAMIQLAQSIKVGYHKALHNLFTHKQSTNESITPQALAKWAFESFGVKTTEREVVKLLSQSSYSFRFDSVKTTNVAREEIAEHTFVDDALYEWYLLNIDRYIWGQKIIEDQGNSMIKIGYPTKETVYKVDDTWIESFRNSFNLPNWNDFDFEPYIDVSSSNNSKSRISNLLKNYQLKDVYNVCETGLFYRMQPEWSNVKVTYKPEKYAGKLSFIACINGDGSDRVPFWLVGNSVSPADLTYELQKRFGFFYSLNTTCRIKASLFNMWLLWFDSRMAGRKVCLLLQKAPIHASAANLKLSNVRLVYINNECGDLNDPLNLGIFRSLRIDYRLKYHQYLIESSKSPECAAVDFSFGNAIRILLDSWCSSLDCNFISCCFRDFFLSVGASPPVQINSISTHKEEIYLLQKLNLQILSMGYSKPMQLWRLLEFPKEGDVHINSDLDDLIDMAEDDALAYEEYELSNGKNTLSSPKVTESQSLDSLYFMSCSDSSPLVSFCSGCPFEYRLISDKSAKSKFPYIPLSNNYYNNSPLIEKNQVFYPYNIPSYNPDYTLPPYAKFHIEDLFKEDSELNDHALQTDIDNTGSSETAVDFDDYVQSQNTSSEFMSRESSDTAFLDDSNIMNQNVLEPYAKQDSHGNLSPISMVVNDNNEDYSPPKSVTSTPHQNDDFSNSVFNEDISDSILMNPINNKDSPINEVNDSNVFDEISAGDLLGFSSYEKTVLNEISKDIVADNNDENPVELETVINALSDNLSDSGFDSNIKTQEVLDYDSDGSAGDNSNSDSYEDIELHKLINYRNVVSIKKSKLGIESFIQRVDSLCHQSSDKGDLSTPPISRNSSSTTQDKPSGKSCGSILFNSSFESLSNDFDKDSLLTKLPFSLCDTLKTTDINEMMGSSRLPIDSLDADISSDQTLVQNSIPTSPMKHLPKKQRDKDLNSQSFTKPSFSEEIIILSSSSPPPSPHRGFLFDSGRLGGSEKPLKESESSEIPIIKSIEAEALALSAVLSESRASIDRGKNSISNSDDFPLNVEFVNDDDDGEYNISQYEGDKSITSSLVKSCH
ncbi:ARS-binding protein 1 [Smittium mucronatum]|uniref:ARS-binding protein 1 n=1 Tax=Smittium mucronatum TaxID=133383 RepID=A0A1R0GXF6_9FUNG|nr:ARS-binding protein 1 [Smittium mucronatum]OLY81581.1 ARS-binding protein 1 [Smittium mucronatum]